MNSNNFKVVAISKEDYFALPAKMREQSSDGAWVKSVINGRETFVRANIVEPNV